MSDSDATRVAPLWSIALLVLGLVLMLAGAVPLAAVCFIVLSARHWLAGEQRKAWGVALLSGATATVMMFSLTQGVFYVAATSMGCLLGALMERNWSYGRRFAVLSGLASSLVAVVMAVTWKQLRKDTTIFMNARIAEFEAQGDTSEQWLEMFRWYDVNYAYIGFGSVVASVLLLVAFLLCVVDRSQRSVSERPRRTTGFQRMRLPDWMVWVAITVALMWMADYRWPNDLLRVISWNAAIIVTCVYWLNGLAILLYTLTILKATALASFVIISGMILFGLMHLLGLVGLFDTWCNFRIRVRRVAMLRSVAYRSEDPD